MQIPGSMPKTIFEEVQKTWSAQEAVWLDELERRRREIAEMAQFDGEKYLAEARAKLAANG